MAEPNSVALDPNALTTVESARLFLGREFKPTEDFSLADLINAATWIAESLTARRLRERWYLNPTALSITTTADSPNVSGSGFTALKAGCDVLGTLIGMGTRIQSITSNVAMVLSAPATATGAASHSFGSAPIFTRHIGGRLLSLEEFPVEEVATAKIVDPDLTRRALDLSDAFLDKQAGILEFGADRPMRGERLEVEMRAGYRPPSNLDLGHTEFHRLRHLTNRVVQVLFQDFKNQIGRSLEVSIRDRVVRFTSLKLPEDILEGFADFAKEQT